MNARHEDTRLHLIETGQRIIAGKGFASVGLAELLSAAGVPKGSFYHWFDSKEQYGRALLEDYFARRLAGLDALLAERERPARERLISYWQGWLQAQSGVCDSGRCLVVKLGAEVADLSDAMRTTLRDGTERIVARIAALIEAGRADGSLADALHPQDTARTLYRLWLGASLVAKLHRNRDALEDAMAFTHRLLAR